MSITGLAFAGGDRPVTWGVAALALLWLLAAGLVVATRVDVTALDMVMLVGFAGLVAWKATSMLWSLDGARSVSEVQRDLVALASVATLLLLARRDTAARVLLGVVMACTFVSTVALAQWLSNDAPMSVGIEGPVGYSNALGLLSGMGLILTLGLLRHAASGPAARLWAIIVACGLLSVTVYLTASRGAWAVLALGLAISLILTSQRPRHIARAVATVCLLALLAVGLYTQVRGSVDVFVQATRAGPSASAPAVSVEPRLRFWTVAWHSARQQPLVGNGAGSFARIWLQRRPAPSRARNAHNLYIETVAELGIVGLVLLCAVLTTPLLAAYRARTTHPLAPAAAGTYTAFLVHAGIDVDWEIPVVTVAGLLCGGALLMMARKSRGSHRLVPPVRIAAVALVLALGTFSYAGVLGNAALQRANEFARVGAFQSASVHARTALSLAPWTAEPWHLLGKAALAGGDADLARARFVRGLVQDPKSWPLWAAMTKTSRGAARQDAARRAAVLNPFELP